MTRICGDLLKLLNCGYEYFQGEQDDNIIARRYQELRAEGKSGGFIPLIIVPSDTLLDYIGDAPLNGQWRQKAALEADELNPKVFLSERLVEYQPGMDLGRFRSASPCDKFTAYSGAPEVIIAKIPAENPWELPLWIPMGGFNECPSPQEQASVFRYWYDKYGAAPAVVTYDIWEMYVANPPDTDWGAEALAKEQYAFCCDIVDQAASGWETLRALASQLKFSHAWFFWWD